MSVKICPFCRTEIKADDETITCKLCDTVHHLNCWNENHGCTTFGCTGNKDENESLTGTVCNSCGTKLEDDQMFCHKCGNKRDVIATANSSINSMINTYNVQIENKKTRKKFHKIIVVSMISLAVISIPVILFMTKENFNICFHSEWIEADCTSQKHCAQCGKSIGSLSEHKWIAATCTASQVCEICGKEEGEPIEHTTTKGKCQGCGEYILNDVFLPDFDDYKACAKNDKIPSYYKEIENSISSDNQVYYSVKYKAFEDKQIENCNGSYNWNTKLLYTGNMLGGAQGILFSYYYEIHPQENKDIDLLYTAVIQSYTVKHGQCTKEMNVSIWKDNAIECNIYVEKGNDVVEIRIENPKFVNMMADADDYAQVMEYLGVDIYADKELLGDGYVNTQRDPLSLRKEPDSNSELLTLIPRKTKVTVYFDSNEGWYYTTYNGKNGYVNSNYITFNENDLKEEKKEDKVEEKYDYIGIAYVDVAGSTLNLREKPNTDCTILASIPDATQLVVYKTNTNGWYYTSFKGKTGYVSADYINFSTNKPNDSYNFYTVKTSSIYKKGMISTYGNTIASYTTNYVVNNGAFEKMYSELSNGISVVAKSQCSNYGITWYELWDANTNIYYGWVDSSYIDFSILTSSNELQYHSVEFKEAEPMYVILCGASMSESEANDLKNSVNANGFSSLVLVSSDWTNLNSETWYITTAGTYSDESEANSMLRIVQKVYPDAYVKYTGDYKMQ